MSTSQKIRALKNEYVRYFQDVPVQKYAAMAIGKDEDTILRWKKQDKTFADAILKAKAEWVRKKCIASKAEFALERLEAEVFGRKHDQRHLGLQLPTPIVYFPADLPYSVIHSTPEVSGLEAPT